MRAMDAWPFACYPLFDGLSQPYARAMQIVVTLKDGSEHRIDPEKYRATYQYRWGHLLRRILQNDNPEDRGRRLQMLWQVIRQTEPWTADARYVRFYSVRHPVDPARWNEPPDDSRLLYQAVTDGRGP
jgi:hypothetical protein